MMIRYHYFVPYIKIVVILFHDAWTMAKWSICSTMFHGHVPLQVRQARPEDLEVFTGCGGPVLGPEMGRWLRNLWMVDFTGQNGNLTSKNGGFTSKNGGFTNKNGDFTGKNGETTTSNSDLPWGKHTERCGKPHGFSFGKWSQSCFQGRWVVHGYVFWGKGYENLKMLVFTRENPDRTTWDMVGNGGVSSVL